MADQLDYDHEMRESAPVDLQRTCLVDGVAPADWTSWGGTVTLILEDDDANTGVVYDTVKGAAGLVTCQWKIATVLTVPAAGLYWAYFKVADASSVLKTFPLYPRISVMVWPKAPSG